MAHTSVASPPAPCSGTDQTFTASSSDVFPVVTSVLPTNTTLSMVEECAEFTLHTSCDEYGR